MANISKEERARREAEDNIRKENEELKNQLAKMMEMFQSLQDEKKVDDKTVVSVESKAVNTIDSPIDIDINARISVTSITTGGVNLKTANDGSARHFRLEKLGQTLPIMYEHLINCINTDRWLFEDGLVYINNAQVVRDQYLEEFYQKFLTLDKIQNILNFDIETIKDMVKSTTPSIQETIATVVAEKIIKGETVDMNKVEIIGKCCEPNIDIRDLANKLR